MKNTKYIISCIVCLCIIVVLVFNNNPRFFTQDIKSIEIQKCECSELYNITCKSWLGNTNYKCVIEEGEICGKCIAISGASGTTDSTPSKPGP